MTHKKLSYTQIEEFLLYFNRGNDAVRVDGIHYSKEEFLYYLNSIGILNLYEGISKEFSKNRYFVFKLQIIKFCLIIRKECEEALNTK